MHLINNAQLVSLGNRGAIVGIAYTSMNNGLVQGGGIQGGGIQGGEMGMVGLGTARVVAIATGSPMNQVMKDGKTTQAGKYHDILNSGIDFMELLSSLSTWLWPFEVLFVSFLDYF
ncbi:hypothetical protein L1049_019748 [Liquidambar formosana]|uniref:Uncharacterized protein n=1 Tax=Liquidambar formosana TaxID=63359 RepID=A0AAP0S674_LIQFO